MYSVDVIIPTYKPKKRLLEILRRLNRQQYPVRNIFLVNTDEAYYERFLKKLSKEKNGAPEELFEKVQVSHVRPEEFDHGGTRKMAAAKSDADILVFMTDDALPADERLIGELVAGLGEQKAAVCYARQLANQNCGEAERFTRMYNYPDRDCIKSAADLDRLGIKTYFCSNVCAAYWRNIYEESGGFTEHTIFNEDMIFAAGVVKAGYRIVYRAQAKVLHSHSYTNLQQFRRNFDIGVSQALHPEVFEGIRSEGEGLRMVKMTAVYLCEKRKSVLIPGLLLTSACKYAGFRLGRLHRYLPRKVVLMCTGNRMFWEKQGNF